MVVIGGFMNEKKAILLLLMAVSSVSILLWRSNIVSTSGKSFGGVDVSIARVPESQVDAMFGGQGKHLKGKNAIVPLKVTISNHSSKAHKVTLSNDAISNMNIVRKRVQKNVGLIATVSTIGGLCVGGPIGAIAFGAGFGTDSANKNKYMLEEMKQEALFGAQIIPAKSAMSKIMFVPESKLSKNDSIVESQYIIVNQL